MRRRDLRGSQRFHLVGAALLLLAALHSAPAAAQESITFSFDLETTLAEARESGKPVVLAFAAVWCPHCRQMEEVTLRDPLILGLAERFHWVIIDIDRNLTLARQYEVVATPQIYFLDSNGSTRRRIVGAVPPVEYAALLSSFLGDLESGAPAEGIVEEEADYSRTDLTFSPKGYRGLSICFSHVGYGPLNVTTQSPFQSLRLALVPRSPSTLAKGQIELKAAGTWANIWANDDDNFVPEIEEYGRYLLDYETLHGSLSLGYGISDTLQVEFGIENRSRFGGAMDSFIQSFHDAFSLDQSGRDEVPKDDFTIFLDPQTGADPVSLDSGARGSFSTNFLFTFQHNVTCGTQKYPAFSYAVTARWAAESDDLEGDDFDLGASVAAARRWGKFYGYATLGVASYGSDTFRGIELRDTQIAVLIAVEWRWRPRQSFLVQWLASEGAAEDFDPFSEPANEITLGWKGEIASQGVLEIGLIENVFTVDNSPDFGIHIGYIQRF